MDARAILLAVALLPLAGCASPEGSPAVTPPSVPATSHVTTPEGAPASGSANETPVFTFERTFNGTSEPYAAEFAVEKAGWLCVHAYLRPSEGHAAITLIDPFGTPTTVASTADDVLLNDTVLINDAPGTWRLRIDLQGYAGEAGVLVSQMG